MAATCGNLDALRGSVAAATHLLGSDGKPRPEWAAAIRVAETLAERLDALEAGCFLREDGKADTTTASQYQRALDALGLTPGRVSAEPTGTAAKPERATASIADFRQRMRVVC